MYRKIFCILLLIQVLFFCEGYAGDFRVYLSGDKCLVEMPREMLGRFFLMVSRLDSVYGHRSYQPGSKLGEACVVSFRRGTTGGVDVYMPDYRLRKEASSGEMGKLLARNQVEWPVVNCPIEEEDEGKVVIDIAGMMRGEQPFFDCVGKRVIGGAGEEGLFYCTMMREMAAVRRKWKRQNDIMTELPVTTTFFLLPESPWQMREADRRMGFSSESYDYFPDESSGVCVRRIIRRWALEPQDKVAYQAGCLTEPVCPIVFYLDPAIPKSWKPYFKRAVEDWQRAFEIAGFRNAIVAREMEQGEKSLSVRQGLIRYQDSLLMEVVDVNADPRSGQIIQAHVHWSPAVLDSLKYEWIARSSLWQDGFNPDEMPEQVVGELIRVTVGRRVGIALGLLPNDLAAEGYSVKQLRNRDWLAEHGGTFLMGCVALNSVAQVEDRVAVEDLFPRVGDYEYRVIYWGYRYWENEIDGKKLRAEWLRQYIEQSGYGWHSRVFPGVVNVVANSGYLGEDPVAGAGYALENVKRVFVREDLIKVEHDTTAWGAWVQKAGGKQGILYDIVLPVLRQVGGLAIKPDGRNDCLLLPVPVAKEMQKRAVAFLNRYVFETPDWVMKSRLVEKSGVEPEKIVSDWQGAILEYLFNESLVQFARNNLMAEPGAAYTLNELMNDLYEGIWTDSRNGQTDGCRMALRWRYLDILKNYLMRNPRENVSLALRLHLDRVKETVERVLSDEKENLREWSDLKIKIEDVLK